MVAIFRRTSRPGSTSSTATPRDDAGKLGTISVACGSLAIVFAATHGPLALLSIFGFAAALYSGRVGMRELESGAPGYGKALLGFCMGCVLPAALVVIFAAWVLHAGK